MGVTKQKGCVGVVSTACTHNCVLLVCLEFLAQVGDIPREEQQENKAQKIQCSLCFPEVSFLMK